MNYPDGQEVLVGDTVRLGSDNGGIVVCDIDAGKYTPEHPEAQWSYLKTSVMIEFPTYGLIHFQQSDPDLNLVFRSDEN